MISFYYMMQFFTNLDVFIFLMLNTVVGNYGVVDQAIVFFAVYLAFVLPIAFLVLLYRESSSFREKIWLAGGVFFSALFTKYAVEEFIRLFYHRPRPFLTYDIQSLFTENSYSFPSGHASFFFAFSFAIYLYNKKWGIWFLIASLLMTIARVMAGVHYPSDILGGMILGVVVAYLTFVYLGPSLKKLIGDSE